MLVCWCLEMRYMCARHTIEHIVLLTSLFASPFYAGTGIDPDYVQDAGSAYCKGAFYQPLCDECAPCNVSKPLGREAMGAYKYQISAEGYGPTADAIYVGVVLLLLLVMVLLVGGGHTAMFIHTTTKHSGNSRAIVW